LPTGGELSVCALLSSLARVLIDTHFDISLLILAVCKRYFRTAYRQPGAPAAGLPRRHAAALDALDAATDALALDMAFRVREAAGVRCLFRSTRAVCTLRTLRTPHTPRTPWSRPTWPVV